MDYNFVFGNDCCSFVPVYKAISQEKLNTYNILRFVLHFIIYLIVIAGIAAFPLYKMADYMILEGLLANTLLFFFITVVSYWIIMRKGVKNANLLNSFMVSLVAKMLIALIYFMLLLKQYQGREIDFAITFFAAYLVCTAFEVYYLLHNLRQI
jgi:heme/copper-type cytochrome/quinol oxidase subunit 4